MGNTFLVFFMVIDTSAIPSGFAESEPEKITLSIFSLRRIAERCSPNTQRMASTILDFPQPFGPTTQVNPPLKSNVVLLANDLNP